jgi:hypothetical protein
VVQARLLASERLITVSVWIIVDLNNADARE